jgi:hypothetical protein
MTSIITGDIINSRKVKKPEVWLNTIKEVFNAIGPETKTWEIYKGDYFQIEVDTVENALFVALKLKAVIKNIKPLDVRMAIGIGEKSYDAPRISEANGEAFIHSGELFESLKKNTLAIKSPWTEFDDEMNLHLDLASLTMNNWTVNSAQIMALSFSMPNATQTELAKKLEISQGRVSERQKRAGYDEIIKMENRYRLLLKSKIG